MANRNNEVIGIEELTLYNNLIKQYINFQYPKVSPGQIDDLFPTNPDPNPGGGDDPVDPGPSLDPTVLPTKNFGEATEEEIAITINGYYNGLFTLEEIQEYWHVGDLRTIHLSSMNATGVGEAHAEQDAFITILDFEHDDLTTSINGKTKSLITVQLYTALIDVTQEENSRVENGYMNATDTNIGGWEGSARRTWCNSTFYNALPQYMKNLVKNVNKITSGGGDHYPVVTTSDKTFLLSELEIFGSITNSYVDGGSQYSYYTWDSAKRRKKFTNSGLNYDGWWERSSVLPQYSNQPKDKFCFVNASGAASGWGASHNLAISPAWCM